MTKLVPGIRPLDPIMTGEVCQYCMSETVYTNRIDENGYVHGMVYICKDCDAYVGVHKGSNISLGSVAKSKLRSLRIVAHETIDPFFKEYGYTRNQVYRIIRNELDIPKDICHIGMLNEQQCQKVISLFRKKHRYEILKIKG